MLDTIYRARAREGLSGRAGSGLVGVINREKRNLLPSIALPVLGVKRFGSDRRIQHDSLAKNERKKRGNKHSKHPCNPTRRRREKVKRPPPLLTYVPYCCNGPRLEGVAQKGYATRALSQQHDGIQSFLPLPTHPARVAPTANNIIPQNEMLGEKNTFGLV
jgi:hypothetical protein